MSLDAVTALSRAYEFAKTWGLSGVPVMPPVRTLTQRMRWLHERQQTIGASDLASILGLPGAYSSPFALWWAKQQPIVEDVQTPEQEWGHRYEPVVAAKWADEHPERVGRRRRFEVVRPPAGLWAHPLYEWMTCTPDFLVLDRATGRAAPLECKTDQNPDRWGATDPPDCYRAQLGYQCLVLGVDTGHLAGEVRKRFHQYTITFGREELTAYADAALEFRTSIVSGEPPALDGVEETTRALANAYPEFEAKARMVVEPELAARWHAARAALDAARTEVREVENLLRFLAGESAGLFVDYAGRTIARRERYPRRAYEVRATTVDRVVYVKPGED